MFKRRKEEKLKSVIEQRFDDVMKLIRDLSRPDYKRLKEGMDLGYEALQKIRSVRSEEEKEFEDINDLDKAMTKEYKNAKD